LLLLKTARSVTGASTCSVEDFIGVNPAWLNIDAPPFNHGTGTVAAPTTEAQAERTAMLTKAKVTMPVD